MYIDCFGSMPLFSPGCPCQKDTLFEPALKLDKSLCILVKRMSGKGGPRHTSKPHVDVSLFLQTLQRHESIIMNFGAYTMLSRSQSVDPKGLMHCFPLLDDLIKLSKTAEIHSQPIRQALLKLLQENPNLHDTKFNGSVFVNLKAERTGVPLCHLRRLKFQVDMGACAAKLTSAELGLLQKLVGSVDTKRQVAKRIVRGTHRFQRIPKLPEVPGKKKTLTKGKSKEASTGEAAPPSFFRGRIGQKASSAGQKQEEANEGDWQKLWGKKKKNKKKAG